jgi:hypothetical protein
MTKRTALALVAALATTGFAPAFGDVARVAEIKAEIRAIALENLGRRDNLAETRALLEPLVAELSQFHAPESAEADLPALEGAWKEIFSDDVEPEPPGFSTDRDSVYQVISSKGYFYNLADLKGPGPLKLLGVLRGKYTPSKDFLNIEFTKVSIRASSLRADESLTRLAERLEAGSVFTVTPPGDSRAPNGPVGAKGNIKNLYIDADFRVATGSNFADGKYDFYVLDKVANPVNYK